MKFKKLKTSTARELVEYYVLNQEELKVDREYTYKLGNIIGKRVLNQTKILRK